MIIITGMEFHLWKGKAISFCNGHFHLKILKQWETFEGAPRPSPGARPGAMEAIGFHVIPGL